MVTVSSYTLGIDGRLLEMGAYRAILDNPSFKSTYFNINGERSQTFIGTNLLSDTYTALQSIDSIDELAGTQYGHFLTDVFSKGGGSLILNKMFKVGTNGKRKPGTGRYLKPVYIDDKFYIRLNPAVEELKGRKVYDYINSHFNQDAK